MGISETFKVLSDEQRREILILLREERKNAGELAAALGITPAALSYHLKLLKNADMVIEYKEKNFVYYELNTSIFDELMLWFGKFGGDKNEKKDFFDDNSPVADNKRSGAEGNA